MTEQPNPFEEMMRLSQDWVKTMTEAKGTFTPEAREKLWPTMPLEAMEAFMGKTLNPQGLDAKTKLLLTLLGLTIQGAVAESQVRFSIRHLREAGATEQEIQETIALAGLFGGAPGMAKALQLYQALKESEE